MTAGADYAVRGATNEITDLAAEDLIDLSVIDADKHTSGDQAFVLVDHLDGHVGEAALRYDAAADVTRLQLDTDGDGHANTTLLLDGDQRAFDHFVL